MEQPRVKPQRPYFSSGPCAKRPGWETAALAGAVLGRSHRSKPGKAKLAEVIERSRRILGIPDDYRLGLLLGSDTGAVECALWSLLGPRAVDVLAWDAFGLDWVGDVLEQLKLPARKHVADYGALPDLSAVDFERDVVFTWNGTTAGVCVPDADWIPAARGGLTICDATSAVFAMRLDWSKLDAVTWSWQKVIGGEGGHGMLALSPRAVERLESHTPAWPMPKLFRLTKKGKLDEGIFRGDTINTPSLLCVEDALDALGWVESIGGFESAIARSQTNAAAIGAWVARTPWIDFLARDAASRSTTSVCLVFRDPALLALEAAAREEVAKKFCALLEKEKVACDIASYRTAPLGLRLWAGATVERADLEALFPWLDWAWEEVRPR